MAANVIKNRGLVTFGNELSRSTGSLKRALNVNVDEDGVATPRRGQNDYGNPTNNTESTVTGFVSQIMEYKNAIIRQYQSSLEFEDTSGVFQPVTGTFDQALAGFRTKWQEANSNLYFTSDDGIKKISKTSNADFSADMVTNAGGIKAGYTSGIVVPTVGGFLPPSSKVGYRVVIGTKDANNNLIEGSPSARFIITNFSEDVETFEISSVTMTPAGDGAIVDGDYFIYNTDNAKYTVYFDTTGASAVIPQTADTIGSTYVNVNVTGNASNDNNSAAILANSMSSAIPEITVSLSTNVVTIVATETGNMVDISASSDATATSTPAGITTLASVQGATTLGSDANVSITGVIPSDATIEYFYQIYRTSTITTSLGVTITDIDPGDEMNIVFESGFTAAEITAGEFTLVDTTPESFRAEGAPLYTNSISGGGILQANESPPIALDIELFRNYMFYANTKQRHRLEFTIISVDDFVSDSTRFIVGNDTITRYYSFVGTAEVTDVTIDALPTAGDYIELSSANDERLYYIYFGDSGDDPAVSGSVGYGVSLTGLVTPADVAAAIELALQDNVDFSLSVAVAVITFTHTNNGYTAGITNGVGSDITIAAPSTAGTGELSGTDEGGDVLLSGLVSVGQSIDETARSLVKIISKDPNSPVNAYYLSSDESLPGNILLEARSLEDKSFFVSIEESGFAEIGGEFNPELPRSQEIEEFTGNTTTTTIKLTSHGLSTGDTSFVGYFKDPSFPSDPDSFSDVYTVTVLTVDTFTIPVATPNTVISFVPAFSTIFSADVESDNETLPNRIYFSKRSQPEAVPIVNFVDVGTRDGEIRRILALRDELYILKDDGIFVLSGTSAPDNFGNGGWSTRLIDNTKIIAPDSAVVLNNQIYCLTEQGVARISGSSVGIISRGIENLIDQVTNQGFDFSPNTFGIPYENDRAYILFAPKESADTTATQAFRYNIFEKTWTRWEYEANCGYVLSRDNKLYLGDGERNLVSQERKNIDRTDHSDRNFTNTILSSGVSGAKLALSTLTNTKVNDVIVQQQDVTITFINNRILKKMDFFDSGITPPASSTMFDSFMAVVGDNLATKMQDINDYLRTLDPTNITVKTFTLSNIKAETQTLVDELNASATITAIKTYKDPYTIFYEAYITEVDLVRNVVTLHTSRPFVEGDVEVYKGFTCNIEWNPQHFGDPSALKQIRFVTIMFDQNNFYRATAKFASDASQAVNVVEFSGKGIGYWGDLPWGAKNNYWGGVGNDIPFRNPVPRGKQKCRYLSLTFEHKNAREFFKIIGISGEVRLISNRAYGTLGG